MNGLRSIWGFKARSQSTFATNSRDTARSYGDHYIVFPIGKFKYTCNDDVVELYKNYDTFEWMTSIEARERDISEEDAEQNVFDDVFVPKLKEYNTSDLNGYLKVGPGRYSECIFNSKSYYIINNEWRVTLLEWYSNKYWKKG